MRRPFTIILAAVSYYLGKNGYPMFGFKSDGTPKEMLVDSSGQLLTSVAADSATGPATTAAAVTPNDDTALTSRGVWVGGTGDLSVRLSGAPSTTVVFTGVPAGSLLPISVVRVMAATTATNIVALN